MADEIIKNDNAITLDWGDVTSATKYWLQVSKKYLDFRATLLHEDNNIATSTDTVTATGNESYYWRWRPYVSGVWTPWREWNSFIVNTGASDDVSATSWMFINKADITDTYILDPQPVSKPIEFPEHIYEAKRRNRAGKLRSQHFVTKGRITIDIAGSMAMGNDQKAEIMRFYNLHTAFYLATRYDNQTENDYVYRCYEVEFVSPPQLDVVGGNTIELEEV